MSDDAAINCTDEEADPRLDGMDARRELRTLSRRLAGHTQTDSKTWLGILLMLKASGVEIPADSTLVIKTEWQKHHDDVHAENLAKLFDARQL